jgi:hypothetical protein
MYYRINTFLMLPAACVAAGLFVTTPALADTPDTPAGAHATAMALAADLESTDGTIKSVNDDSFVLKDDDGDKRTFMVDDDTVYTLEGKAASKDEVLKAGAKVAVTHKGKTAVTVTAED